ncbi:DNA-binding MurR/RpiR family transcriptional regulator [Thermocatellispora tengchongensis]|uniref:DNA-binding MurR/RpiR family transcriptional regulator n=1 Tax=Thermocatellispora tengchongensis TaxID=1073253 RepID=A0A840PJ87_9ACTN|nr:MurR/RpiR family transcriptional regulator [Thermocatellispora tengchongensis]MBB5139029.1 DNA-binding MurR/RpiR family transcriptional regulator [Thermocatellispora tengchongensis]
MQPAGDSRQTPEGQPDDAAGVIARIRAMRSSFVRGDLRVADAVLHDPAAVVHSTVSDLATEAGTAPSTVVRFCQRLGLRGYHALKLAIARELGAGNAMVAPRIGADDSPLDVLTKIIASDAETLREVTSTIDAGQLERAVNALHDAGRILVVGVGTSAPLAQDFAYRLTTIGLHADAPADAHVQHVTARLLSPSDVCLAVSHTGSTRETVAAVEAARDVRATTIAVTSFVRSPLTEAADAVLVAGSRETSFRIEAMASRIAHLSLLDAMFVALALRRPAAASAALELTGGVLAEHRF